MVAQVLYSEKELEWNQIKSDAPVTENIFNFVVRKAKEWGVSPEHIAILGGKPYPMQGALFQWLNQKCEKEGLIVQSISVQSLQRADHQSVRAGAGCWITLFDLRNFNEIMKKLPGGDDISIEVLEHLRKLLTHTFYDEGWASPESVKMRPLHNPDYINHMASTRAIDRTIRIIVRSPFTAFSEMPDGDIGTVIDAEKVQRPDNGGTAEAPMLKPSLPAAAPAPMPFDRPKQVSVTVPPETLEKPIDQKQVKLIAVKWAEYVKAKAPGLKGETIEEKRRRFMRAAFGKEAETDLTVANLRDWLDMMEKGEINITPE